VFDGDGEHVATVVLPSSLTVHEIGADYIAGIVRDPESGRHAVLMLSLARSVASMQHVGVFAPLRSGIVSRAPFSRAP
jgi:hypothetical protein